MTPEIVTDFLTSYIRSLREETRQELKGPRHGFDHIIYELALAYEMIPIRLSFFRQGENELVSPKKEAEHGVDQSFITRDGKVLWVFVLKDEVLSYRNWTSKGFDTDLRMARDQDLTVTELKTVREVRIILAYNKDENEEGIECFEKFVRSSGTKIGDGAVLQFERWNLTTITERVREKLLTPSLLPESFFKRFTYLCWQVGDFDHGSPQWTEVLLPDWREFLAAILLEPVSERNVRLVSVALIILRSHGKRISDDQQAPSFSTGWIDLLEWAMIALWSATKESIDDAVWNAAFQMWLQFYVTELERYYEINQELLFSEHSLEVTDGLSHSEGLSTYLAYWHMGRLGMLAMAVTEIAPLFGETLQTQLQELEIKVVSWIVRLLNANPSCQRPLLDIQHIEIYLISRALARFGKWDDLLTWFHSLFERLLYRRLGKAGCRVIDYGNSWDLLFEYLATGEEPYSGFGRSSYLILQIMEISLGAPEGKGQELANVVYRQLILGENGDGSKFPFKDEVRLMGWIPPKDWGQRILREKVIEGVSLPAFFSAGEGDLSLPKSLRRFIDNTRKESELEIHPRLPNSALVLACLKRLSPLPNEFWRRGLFGPAEEVENESRDAG